MRLDVHSLFEAPEANLEARTGTIVDLDLLRRNLLVHSEAASAGLFRETEHGARLILVCRVH